MNDLTLRRHKHVVAVKVEFHEPKDLAELRTWTDSKAAVLYTNDRGEGHEEGAGIGVIELRHVLNGSFSWPISYQFTAGRITGVRLPECVKRILINVVDPGGKEEWFLLAGEDL